MTIHKTNTVFLSETYLDSPFPVNDENFVIQLLILSMGKFTFTTRPLNDYFR